MPLAFYGFARTITEAIERRGYAVTAANEEYPATLLTRVLSKLDLPVVRDWTRREINRRFLSGRRWDLVLIIKGRGIGPELIADFKASGARVVGYHFDALSYDRGPRRWSPHADRVSTFDYRDATREGWPLVELFSTTPSPESPPPIRLRISAIQRNHSDRLAYLDRVLTVTGMTDAFVHIFESTPLNLLYNALRQPRLYWKWRKYISLKPLPYDRYAEVLATSDFTLDYAHPGQTGATMRSMEALALGVKLISNNPHMLASRHFNDRNVIPFPLDGDAQDLKRGLEDLAGRRPEPFRRSPDDFVAEVLAEPFG
jgi:hypothetical protein